MPYIVSAPMLYIVSTPTATVLHVAINHGGRTGWREYTHTTADLPEARRQAWLMAKAFASYTPDMLPFWEYSA